jgi:hypothetical protein
LIILRMNGDTSWRSDLDKLSRFFFKELDPHLSTNLWHNIDSPLHYLILGYR